MASADDNLIHIGQALWSGVLSVLGGLIVWNWNRLSKQVDDKADKSEVTQLREDLAERWKQQDSMHAENRTRLDQIYQLLANRRQS